MKKLILLCIALACCGTSSYAQESGNRFNLKDKIFFGGGVTATFGNVTVLGASPMVGYKINKRLSAGVGAEYLYYREKWQGLVYATSIYGGNIFSRYRISERIFAHGEMGFINWELPVFDPIRYIYTTERRNVPHLYLGGGYVQPISQRSSFIIMALYDALYNPLQSASPSPFIFRAGFNVGF